MLRFWHLAILTVLSYGCAANEDAIEGDPFSEEAEIRSLRGLVTGDYGSDLGKISLKADGTYVGGYASSPDANDLLLSERAERGSYRVRRGKLATQGNVRLNNAVLVLKPASGLGEKAQDLIVRENGDIQVSRGGKTQIWVRQLSR